MFIKREEWEEQCLMSRALLKDNEEKRILIDKLTIENKNLKEQNHNLLMNEQIMKSRLEQY